MFVKLKGTPVFHSTNSFPITLDVDPKPIIDCVRQEWMLLKLRFHSWCGLVNVPWCQIDIAFSSIEDTEAYIEQHAGVRLCNRCKKHLR